MEDGDRAMVKGFLGDKPSCLHGGLAKVEVGDGLGCSWQKEHDVFFPKISG